MSIYMDVLLIIVRARSGTSNHAAKDRCSRCADYFRSDVYRRIRHWLSPSAIRHSRRRIPHPDRRGQFCVLDCWLYHFSYTDSKAPVEAHSARGLVRVANGFSQRLFWRHTRSVVLWDLIPCYHYGVWWNAVVHILRYVSTQLLERRP